LFSIYHKLFWKALILIQNGTSNVFGQQKQVLVGYQVLFSYLYEKNIGMDLQKHQSETI